MGMGFPSISEFQANPYFQTLVASAVVDEPIFSFKLGTTDSQLFLGGADRSKYTGDFIFVPVEQEVGCIADYAGLYRQYRSQGYWQVALDGVSVGGVIASGATSAIIDTGSTLIIGDSASVERIYQSMEGARDNKDGTYTGKCNLFTPCPWVLKADIYSRLQR